jgi:hypothetical protein
MEDYRNFPYDEKTLLSYGKILGRQYYWKMYASENLLRLIIHSILSVQIKGEWWKQAVDPDIIKEATKVRAKYNNSRIPNKIPKHDIYCIYMPMLERIISDNRLRFIHYLPQIDKLIISLNAVIIPRNLLGHMNTLDNVDRGKIGGLYKICLKCLKILSETKNLVLKYPF